MLDTSRKYWQAGIMILIVFIDSLDRVPAVPTFDKLTVTMNSLPIK